MPGAGQPAWETRDLGSAAYAFSRGLRVRLVDRDERGVRYVFEDPEGRGEALKYEFSNSVERRFDDCVKELKRLGATTESPRPRR